MSGQELDAFSNTHTKLLASFLDLLDLGIRETFDFQKFSRGAADETLIQIRPLIPPSGELSTYRDCDDVVSFEFGNIRSIDTWDGQHITNMLCSVDSPRDWISSISTIICCAS
jgi:hypothetical protein